MKGKLVRTKDRRWVPLIEKKFICSWETRPQIKIKRTQGVKKREIIGTPAAGKKKKSEEKGLKDPSL